MSSQFESLAAIHFRDLTKSDPNGYGNGILRQTLAEKGVGLALISGKDSYDLENKKVLASVVIGDDNNKRSTVKEIDLGPDGVSVVRARVATSDALEQEVEMINGMRLRRLGASKFRQYEIAPDMTPKTIKWHGNIDEIDQLSGDVVVVKADMSQGGKHVAITPKSQVHEIVSQMAESLRSKSVRSNNDIIVQEFARGHQWPFRARTGYAKEMLRLAESQELRVYCYAQTDGQSRYYATGRSLQSDADKWAEIAQESVPDKVWEMTSEVSRRVTDSASVKSGFFAIDFIRGEDDEILIREINTRDPMMVSSVEGEADMRIQRKLLGTLLAERALKAGAASS